MLWMMHNFALQSQLADWVLRHCRRPLKMRRRDARIARRSRQIARRWQKQLRGGHWRYWVQANGVQE